MRKIPKTFKRNGYDYTFLKRIKDLVLYEQFKDFKSEGSAYAYEVHKVRIKKPSTRLVTFPNGITQLVEHPLREILADNEDFGYYGWSFQKKDNAMRFFDAMVKGKSVQESFEVMKNGTIQ